MAAWRQAAKAVAMCALLLCVMIAIQSSHTISEELVEEEQGAPEAAAISSACLRSQDDCVVAVPGGSLKLWDVQFPNGKQKPGIADAVGYVYGKFVTGRIKLSPLEGPAGKSVEGSKKALGGKRAQLLKDVPSEDGSEKEAEGDESPEGSDSAEGNDESSEEYKATLAAVEANIEERQKKVEEEAKKIAEAVTRVITSKEVSKKIADLAMDTAAEKEGPVEASLTGGVSGGVNGIGQFGYSSLPSGTQVPNCGTNCGKQSDRTGASIPSGERTACHRNDLISFWPLAASSSSSAFYSAWKASGGQAGVVVPQATVMIALLSPSSPYSPAGHSPSSNAQSSTQPLSPSSLRPPSSRSPFP